MVADPADWSLWLFTLLIGATGIERLVELRLSRKNAAWSRAHGGVEAGAEHYPVMVVLHSAFLAGCLAEAWLLRRPFSPAPGASMLALAALSQGLRWWCIRTLGPRWNTRVIVVPGLPRVVQGPYRFLSHPNYLAVVVEGFALPLVHGAWLTALSFTLLNAALLRLRIRTEDRALQALEPT